MMSIEKYESAFEQTRIEHNNTILQLQLSIRELFENTTCSVLLEIEDVYYAYYDFDTHYRKGAIQIEKEDEFSELIELLKKEQLQLLEKQKNALMKIDEVHNTKRYFSLNKLNSINSISAAKAYINNMGLKNSYEVKSYIIQAYKNGKR